MKNMLNATVLAASLVTCVGASASRLVCWNLFSKAGAKPFVTANIVRNDEISHLKINNPKDAPGAFDDSGLQDQAVGQVITAKTSPYKGLNAYSLKAGVRLILPVKLDAETVASTQIKAGYHEYRGQNAVLDVAGNLMSIDQGGHSFYRMHCLVK